ncbi:MAG: hypothetical protein V2I65_12860 [Paracoccaceae bacterium]|nr:hypothetical protein [Paracoccaceae bacterium]
MKDDSPARAEFGLRPVVPGNWAEVPRDLEGAFRQRLAGSGLVEEAGAVEAIRILPLPFFDGWMLCDFLMGEVGPGADPELAAMVVLYGPDGFTPLDDYRRIERHIEIHGVDLGDTDACLSFLLFAGTFGAVGDPLHVAHAGTLASAVTLEMAHPDAAKSPLDRVRAPTIARGRLEAVSRSTRLRLELRLAADGEITVLDRADLGPAGVRDRVRREGAMRYVRRKPSGDAR